MQIRLARQRRRALIFLYVAFLLGGARAGFLVGLPESRLSPDLIVRTDLLLAIPCSLGCMWFCTVDSKLLGKPIIQLAKLGIFLFWPVGVPVYLCWARRLRGVLVLLLHGGGIFLTVLGATLAAAFLLYGHDWYA